MTYFSAFFSYGCSLMTTSRIATAGLVAGLVVALANTGFAVLVGYFPLNENNNPSLGTTVADASGGSQDGLMSSDGTPMVGGVEGIASANASLYGTAFSFGYVAPDFGNY